MAVASSSPASSTPPTPGVPRRVSYDGNRVIYYLRRHWRAYLVGLLSLIAASALALLPPFIVGEAIDAIEAGTTGRTLAGYGALILVLAAGESVARYLSRQYVSGRARMIERSLRTDLANHLLQLDQRFYVKSRTGDLMARCTNDLQWVRDFLGPTLVDTTRTVVMVLIGMVFLLWIDVELALISIAYLPLAAGTVAYFESTVERRYQAVQDQFGELTNRVQENVSGIRAVKAHALEDAEIASFRKANEEMRRRAMSLASFVAALMPVMILASGTGTVLVLWFGGRAVVAGEIDLGEFVMFMTVLALLANQLSVVGWVLAMWQQGVVAIRRINYVLRTEPRVVDPVASRELERVRGEVEFRHVTATYATESGEGEDVLRDVNLRIPAGSTTAIVGGTGAGKTTLVNLLVRLVDPVEGEVLIDGVDVRDLPLELLRQAIGFVPQESFLFSDSLRDNIFFGRDDASEEALTHAVMTSQLVNDLDQFHDGIDTVIGERGVTLSGGQKQRASLARALLKDPPVLVLDDALSHVDTHTEEEILRRLHDFMAERTTIVIAHRTSTLKGADRIVVLEGGTIVEEGTHQELLDRGGAYARLYRQQRVSELHDREVELRDHDLDGDGTSGDGRGEAP